MVVGGSFFHPLWRLSAESRATAAPGDVTLGQNISMVHLEKIPGLVHGFRGPGQILSDVNSQSTTLLTLSIYRPVSEPNIILAVLPVTRSFSCLWVYVEHMETTMIITNAF